MVDRYAQQAAALAEELVESLTEPEIQALRATFFSVPLSAWLQWQDDYAADVEAFVQATPAARRKRKRWKNLFPALTYAAYLQCCRAQALLQAVSQYDLSPGGSYRRTVAAAAAAFDAAEDFELGFPEWPWGGDSPVPLE